MSKTASKPISKGARTAADLLIVARDLFAAQGYAAVSMREIALKCGIGAGAIYNHFASKQDILMQILESHMQSLLDKWRAEQGTMPNSNLESLQGFVEFHIDYHADKSAEVFLSYMELRSLTPENFTKILAMRDTYEQALRSILTAGQKSGEFQLIDVHVSTKAIIGMLSSLTHWYNEQGRLRPEDIKLNYWQMIRKSVQPT